MLLAIREHIQNHSQIPQGIRQISHSTPFCNKNVHTCAHFCYKMVHCGIWDWLCNRSIVWKTISNYMCFAVRLLMSWGICKYDDANVLIPFMYKYAGLILGLCPVHEIRRYKVTPSLIGWAQTSSRISPRYETTTLRVNILHLRMQANGKNLNARLQHKKLTQNVVSLMTDK